MTKREDTAAQVRTLRERAQDAALDVLPRVAMQQIVRQRVNSHIPLEFEPSQLRAVAAEAAAAAIEDAYPPGHEREERLAATRQSLERLWLGSAAKKGVQAVTPKQRAKRSPRMTRFHAAQERMAATRGRPLAPPGPEELALFDLTDIDTKEHHHDHE